MYPPRYQTFREKKDDVLVRHESGENQILTAQGHYLSEFANRTYGGQAQEYGTFGGPPQLRE